MLQNYNKWKVLRVFFDNPNPKGSGLQLREICRIVNISPPSVKNYLKQLKKEELIVETKHRIHGYPVYFANRDNDNFRFLKKTDMTIRIKESGLLDYINDECMPDAVVLFGSASKGEDLAESDVDIFVKSKEIKMMKLEKYEKQLKRKINIFFNSEFNKLSKELKNNILNGVILSGYFKVF